MADVAEGIDADAIAGRIDEIRDRIVRASTRAGRSADEITLVGVTKTYPIEVVRAARRAGLRHFGENRVQDLVAKAEALPGKLLGGDVEWHMIGHLQRNKARDVVEHADWFQALDSPRLARELDKRARRADRVVPCLVQVNISGEDSKYGIKPEEVHAFLDRAAGFEYLRIEGLMGMATHVDDPNDARPEFRRLRQLFDGYRSGSGGAPAMSKLSMGMSNDFEVAIEEGATHVRIGSAIFGPRAY